MKHERASSANQSVEAEGQEGEGVVVPDEVNREYFYNACRGEVCYIGVVRIDIIIPVGDAISKRGEINDQYKQQACCNPVRRVILPDGFFSGLRL